ncbi:MULTISPECIES: DUF2894 domain-containing protein [unclassified Luteimonas]
MSGSVRDGGMSLAGLLDTLDAWRDEREVLAADARQPDRPAWPELPALQGFRALWARMRTEEQLRRALAPAPADAGPLNSVTLVHRTLVLMREESPGYLRHFTAYVDALACLQDVQAQAMPSSAPQPPAARKQRAPGRARATRGPSKPA